MLKAVFKDKSECTLTELEAGGSKGKINGEPFKWDIQKVAPGRWHVIDEKGDSFVVVLEENENNNVRLKINGDEVSCEVKTEFDLLLQKLGISAGGSKKLKEIKAPMPGLVLKVDINEGDLLKEGDTALILEAMKMENVIKSTSEVVVKKIHVKEGDTIEKGQLMVSFE